MTVNTPTWPKRVVHILRYATGRGGTEAHVLHLAAEHVRLGMTVLVIAAEDAPSDELASWFEKAGAEVVRLDVDTRPGHSRFRLLGKLLELGRVLRKWNPDVVHLHSGGHTGGLPVLAMARLSTHATVIHTEHLFPREMQSLRFRIWKRVGDGLSDGLIAVSRANAAFRRRYSNPPESRFAAVLNGIPLPTVTVEERQMHRQDVRRVWNIPDDALVYGVISRLVDWKGVDWAIRAFALLPVERGPILMIVGEGPEADSLKKLATELGVSERVVFTGYQSTPLEYADAMDVYVDAIPLSSGSIALLEAMSRGLPPIITASGPEEAVIDGESGLRAPPSDPPGLASVMARLADNDYREHLGRAARAHIERHFSAERVARDTTEVYIGARNRRVPTRLRADGPDNPRPGDSG